MECCLANLNPESRRSRSFNQSRISASVESRRRRLALLTARRSGPRMTMPLTRLGASRLTTLSPPRRGEGRVYTASSPQPQFRSGAAELDGGKASRCEALAGAVLVVDQFELDVAGAQDGLAAPGHRTFRAPDRLAVGADRL